MLVPTAIDSLSADPSASGWFLLATAVAADAGTLPEQQSSHKTQATDGLWHRHRHSIPSGCLPVTAPTSKPLPCAPSNGSQAGGPSDSVRPSNAVAVKGAEIDLSESLYHASMTPQHIVETALGFDDNISKRSLWAFACSVLTADAHRTRAATAANRNGDEPSSASALSAQRSSTHNIDGDAGSGGVDVNGFSPLSASASEKSAASSMPHRTSAAAQERAAASGTAAFSPIACFSRMDFNDHQASLFGDLLFDIGAAEPATANANPSNGNPSCTAIPDQAEELRPPTVKERDMNGDDAAGRMIPHPPTGSPAAQRPRPIVANDAPPSTSSPAERRGSGKGNMTREPTSTAGEALSGSESNCLADLSPLQSFALDMMVAGSQSGAISGSDWAKIGGALQVAGAAPKLNGTPNHRTPNQCLSPGHPPLTQSNGQVRKSNGGKAMARPLCVAGSEVPIVLVFDFAFRDAPRSLEHFKEIITKDQHNETGTGDASPLELLSPSQQHLRSPASDNASGSPGSWQGLRQQVLAGSCRRKPVLSDGDDDGKKASNSHKRDGNTESGFGEPPLAQTQRDGAEGSTATFDLEPLSSFSEDSFDDGLDSDFQLDMSGNGDSPYGARTPRGPLEVSGVGAASGYSNGAYDHRERPDIIVQRLQEELDERSMADESVDEWADMNNGEAEETTLMARRLDEIRSQLTVKSRAMAFAPPKKPLRATTALQPGRTAESSEIHEKMRCVPEQISSVPMTCGYAREFRVPEQWQRNLFGSFDQRTFGGTGTHKSLGTTTRDRSHLLQTGPVTFGTRSASAGAAPRAGGPNSAQNRDPRGAFRPETSNPHYGRHSPSSDGNNGGNNAAYGDDGQMMSDDSPMSAMPPPTPPGGRGKHPRSMEHSAHCSGTNTPRAAYPHGVTASASAPTFQGQQQGSGPIRAASSGGRGRGLGRSKGAAASGLPIVQSGTAAATAAPVPGLLGRHGAAASSGPPITAAARQAQSLALAQQANVVGAGLAAPWSPSTGARGDAGRAAKKELAVAAKEQKGAWPLPAKASGNFALATTSSAQKLSRELNGRPQDDAIFDPAPPRPEIPMCATTGSRESGLLSSLSHPERKTYKGGVKMTNEEAQYVYDLATYEHNQRLKKVATRPALQIPHCTRVRGGADRVAVEM